MLPEARGLIQNQPETKSKNKRDDDRMDQSIVERDRIRLFYTKKVPLTYPIDRKTTPLF